MPVDYSKGQIYTLRSHQTDAIYIGSTCGPLRARLCSHKSNYKTWKEGKYGYTTSYEIVKYDDAYIELLEDFPCDNKKELNRREGQLIRQNECVNRVVAGRTNVEWHRENKVRSFNSQHAWYEANKDTCMARAKAHYESNKERISQYKAQKVTCECGAVVSWSNSSAHKKSPKHQTWLKEKSHTNLYNEYGVDQASEDTGSQAGTTA